MMRLKKIDVYDLGSEATKKRLLPWNETANGTINASNCRVNMWRNDITVMFSCSGSAVLNGMPLLFDSPSYIAPTESES